MEIAIRRILLPDADTLAAISRQTFYDTFTGTCTVEDMELFLDLYFNLTQIQTELSNPEDLYFFAEVNGEPKAYIRFMEDYSLLPPVQQWKALELKRLYVSSEYHGKGIAQKLMGFYLDYAQQNHYQLAWLGVWEHNHRAKKFYGKYGFVPSGYKHDFPIGSTPQKDEWLWKFL